MTDHEFQTIGNLVDYLYNYRLGEYDINRGIIKNHFHFFFTLDIIPK